MTTYQKKTGRLITGGKLKKQAKKKKKELGRAPTETIIAPEVRRKVRVRGGNYKIRLFRTQKANVLDKSSGKAQQVEINDVIRNPASRAYSRRRIITKGAILDTEIGKARVTSRPGNEGIVNAVLIEEE